MMTPDQILLDQATTAARQLYANGSIEMQASAAMVAGVAADACADHGGAQPADVVAVFLVLAAGHLSLAYTDRQAFSNIQRQIKLFSRGAP